MTPHQATNGIQGGAVGTEQASFSTSSVSSHLLNPRPPHFLSLTGPSTAAQRPTAAAATASPTTASTLAATTNTTTSSLPSRPLAATKDTRQPLHFSFPPLFFLSSTTNSISLAPEAAEGRPIPLDDSTAAHRTSALRELQKEFPAPDRTRYVKSTGAENSTYSQPVIVRTYSGPSSSRHSSHGSYSHRRPTSNRGPPRPFPFSVGSTTSSRRTGTALKPIVNNIVGGTASAEGNNGPAILSINMLREKGKKKTGSKLPWRWQSGAGAEADELPQLPSLEAFSFKSIMANSGLEQSGDNGIEGDLDAIAELCAKSRYSLSNHYEVHVAPHGSGAAFVSNASSTGSGRRRGHGRHHSLGGPTLQAVSSDDDEGAGRSHRKRRGPNRRRSVAYGTLETIMSSSRSSEEDKTKKKSAAEIADEVRGRARKGSSESSPGSGSGSTPDAGLAGQNTGGQSNGQGPDESRKTPLARKKSTSFATAIIDSTRHGAQADVTSPRGSASALISEPALPQTSKSQMEIRTNPDAGPLYEYGEDSQPDSPVSSEGAELQAQEPSPRAPPSLAPQRPSTSGALLPSNWSAWIPWRSAEGNGAATTSHARGPTGPSHAEGSLRQLLKNVDTKDKGKGVERDS